jgi:hypothetical protein
MYQIDEVNSHKITIIGVSIAFKVFTEVVVKSSVRCPLKVNRRFGGTCRLQLRGRRKRQRRNQREANSKQNVMLVSCLAYSSTLKMKSICSSKTLVGFQRTTRGYIPEDRTLQKHIYLRLEVLIAVTKKIKSILRDATTFSPVNHYRGGSSYSESSVTTYEITTCHVPDDRNFYVYLTALFANA